MNYRIVLRLLALIQGAMAVALLASAAVAFLPGYGGWEQPAVLGLVVAAGIALLLGLALFLSAGRGPQPEIYRKEALTVIGLGWLVSSLVGAIPYLFAVPGLLPASAFFESASGLTTTGATVFLDIESLPRPLLFWRSLSQWIGGLGVVVFFVAILSFLGSGAKVLFSREYSGSADDLFDGKMKVGAARILWLYLALSAVCVGLYRLVGLDWFDATCHMFTTIATGGFSTRNNSFADLANPAAEWIAIVFMVVCSVSFLLQLRLLRGDFRPFLARSAEPAAFLVLLALGTVLVLLARATGPGVSGEAEAGGLFRSTVFQVVSLATTTGYSTRDFAAWAFPAQIVLLSLMLVGGCTGSTAGGIKVIRMVVAFRLMRFHIERAFRPHLVRPIRVNRRALSSDGLQEITVFLLLALAGLLGGCLLVAFLEPSLDPYSAFSAVLATLFNTGPGFGAVGPVESFQALHEPTKLVLGLAMILGRLEFFAILVLFAPSLWRRFS